MGKRLHRKIILLPSRPEWSEPTLQGLAFWTGHRRAFFAGHPVPEAAFVTEACNLIYSHLHDDQDLLCERLYRHLAPPGSWPLDLGNPSRARADLVVVREPLRAGQTEDDLSRSTIAVIEVKRAAAGAQKITADLRRLATLKICAPQVRAILFVISESRRPITFVGDDGRAILGRNQIAGVDAYYRVRRACKASQGFKTIQTAHYACMLEVFRS